MTLVEYDVADGVASLHLNRPDRLNAVVPGLVEELLAGLARAAADDAAAVVLAGRGRAFCAGHDLREPESVEDTAAARRRIERLQDVTRAVRAFPGVVVAAVHGYALGAGCEFALGCDLVVAAQDARFGFPEVGVGLSVTGGISSLLPATVGPARAKELLLLGEHLSAADALQAGLVNRVTPVGEHETVAHELAARCRERPRVSVTLAKTVIDLAAGAGMDAALDREVGHALLTRTTGESEQGRERFAERA